MADVMTAPQTGTATAPRLLQMVLLHAAMLVENGWTQGAYARDESGESVVILAPDAAAYCVVGALTRAVAHVIGGAPGSAVTTDYQLAAITALRRGGIRELQLAIWNDRTRRTQGEVVAALRTAADAAVPR